jgi:hypothetical protein
MRPILIFTSVLLFSSSISLARQPDTAGFLLGKCSSLRRPNQSRRARRKVIKRVIVAASYDQAEEAGADALCRDIPNERLSRP